MLAKIRGRATADAALDPFRDPTPEQQAQAEQEDLITERINARVKEIQREQAKLKPSERLSADECWEQASREVHAAIKRNRRRERLRRLTADVASACGTRNAHLFGPWKVGLAFAASGEVGAALAETSNLGIGAAAAAAGAGAATWSAWRRITGDDGLPQRYWSRFRAGLTVGCATCLSLPLLPWDVQWHAAGLAGGVAALIATSARYWRDNEPAYPPMGGNGQNEQAATEQTAADPSASDGVATEAADIIADWNEYVAGTKILPGAKLERPRKFQHGWIFTVKLVRGQQRFDTLLNAVPDIAYALNQPQSAIQPDPNPDPYRPLEPTLTITTGRPDTTYTGPVIVHEDGSVFIELGPYLDGRGIVRYEILSDQLSDEELAKGAKPRGSAVGGFILGDKGSGKTRLQESIALGAMELGVELWYLDPQGGASSPAMRDHVSWPLAGLDSPDGRAFGNVEDLLTALEGVVAVRQDENAALGYTGFQHTRERPMILVIIDECHLVFSQYGQRFGEIDRIARKLGIAFLGASQAPSQDVFGGSITLRNGMAGANGFVLKYNGSNARLAFGGLDDVIARGCQRLRPNRTLGYAVNSARPHAVFQNRFAEDLEPFFKRIQPSTLDELATVGAGEAYARRHDTASQNLAAVQQRLEGYRNGTLKPGQKPKQTKPGSGSGGASGGTVSYLFPGTQSGQQAQAAQNQGLTREGLTGRQQKILDMLTGAQLTAKHLATELGCTSRTVSTDLKTLREAKVIRVVDENAGLYTSNDNLT